MDRLSSRANIAPFYAMEVARDARERIAASPHYKALRSFAPPVRSADKKFPLAQNPFVAFYREAIYGKPTNAHFLEALDNVRILGS